MSPQDVIIEDNLDSDSAISALSANQGKTLDDKITDLSNDLSYMTTTVQPDGVLDPGATVAGELLYSNFKTISRTL